MFSEETALMDDDLSEHGLINGAANELKKINLEIKDVLENKVFFINSNQIENERDF